MAPDPGFGVYIHWPFCLAKCPYCDFNSHVRETIDEARWRAALLAELDHYAAQTPGRTVTSVFFGGGTPSLMAPETAAALVERVKTRWKTAPDLEVTLEANPGAAEAARFAALRAAGVNRLSIGVQALDDAALRFLGRIHGRDEAIAAVENARRHFERYSFDLIYARPGHSVAAWRAELDEALRMAGGHLSVYQLTIEPGTEFHTRARLGKLVVPDEETAAALYETTVERLETAGLPAYEISNHAAPGEACRHNLTYWRYGDYVGVGPGAHGRLTRDAGKAATRQTRLPEAWLTKVEAAGHATDEVEAIDTARRRDELLMMGLRLAEGVGRDRFEAEAGAPIEASLDADAVARLIEGGFLIVDERGIRATAEGRQRLNAVLAALLA
ncbi:MAG: radical SAM family heme chaperone HemW [Candidatus Eiseniibacteriota bacterium]